jgi:deoxycytidylate deaminase
MKPEEEHQLRKFDPSATIIGFTGSIGSGCTMIAETVAKNGGYEYYKLSSFIREYAKEKEIQPTTKNLQSIGNDLRKKYGPHHLARMAIEEIDKDCDKKEINKVVIDSIRNDREVSYLRQFPKFYLISVYADQSKRFDRLMKKNKTYTYEQFMADDSRDATEIFQHGQQVEKCNYMSDIVINNDIEVEEVENNQQRWNYVREKLGKYLMLIESGPNISTLPKSEEKIMTVAYLESLFSSCLQRKVGAVITTGDGIIISSGFNHVPPTEGTCYAEYGMCYRNYLKERHSKKIKCCPECGKAIKYICKECEKEVEGFATQCPFCNEKIDYICQNCRTRVFDVFTPGGKGSVGKLLDVCRSLHAEEHAILNIAKLGGTAVRDTVLYTTTFPCTLCANKIAEVGIRKVFYSEAYTMKKAYDILKNKGVEIEKFEGVKSAAFFKLYGY